MDKKTRMLLSCCAAALSFPADALADKLTTTNGETLEGTVLKETPEAVVFNSLTFGPLTVERKSIATLERSIAPPAATKATPPPEVAAADSKAAEEPATPQFEDRVGEVLAKLNPLKGWKTSLKIGFTARRGDDSDNNLNMRFRSEKKQKDGDEHLISARYDYAEDVLTDGQHIKTDQLLTAQYQYRHNLGEQTFFQSNTRYYRDVIKELDNEGTQTVGLGYRFKGESWNATVTPAIGYRAREIASDWTDSAVVGAYQDYKIQITRTLGFRESLEYLVDPRNSDDYSVRAGLELNQKLGDIWTLGMHYDYAYDAIVGLNASSLQQRWGLTLGIEF